jgi:DNA repair exonuclease SbcCD nuclease subunit
MKFIHLADVHLGAVPDRGCRWSGAREEEIWETFRRVIAGIRKSPVDLLFIAGDLFHRQPLLRELREVNYLFTTIPDTQIFLMAGNHDYLRRDSFYRKFAWSENVTFFDREELTCVKADGLDAYVYGNSYERREIPEPLYREAAPVSKDGFHVLMAHGGDESHAPINVRMLSAAGFDYVALGHIHKPEILYTNKMAYPGSLEPLDVTERGEHGYIEGSYENGQVRIWFVPFSCRRYESLVLTVREDTTQYALEDMLREQIRSRGKQNLYQVVLKGRRSPDMIFLTERLKELGCITEVSDETRPSYQLSELEKRYNGTLIGSYIAHFREKETLTEVEEKALYYGLQALLETANGYQTIGNPKLRKNS